MKKREYAEAVERCIPQTPPVFHQAMSRTLEAIAAQAPAQERAAKVRPALSTRRPLAFALAALLLIATAAVLFVFILIINFSFSMMKRRSEK